MATWNMFNFQDSNSPLSDNLLMFYMFTMLMMLMILTTTIFMMMSIIMNKYTNRFLLKNHTIEMIWTIIPMLILMLIAIPSLKTLYFIDEIWNPSFFTIKCIGHQWYWSYEYPEFNTEFNSYMINDLNNMNTFRLLDTDNRMIIPMKLPIRILTTSTDVIHSWTIPTMGIKMDSTPGRINQMTLFSIRPGIFFGQCSEICGTNHSFMPITLESTSYKIFMNWINSFN